MKKILAPIVALLAILAGACAMYCVVFVLCLAVWHFLPPGTIPADDSPVASFWPKDSPLFMRLFMVVAVDFVVAFAICLCSTIVLISIAVFEKLTEIGTAIMAALGGAGRSNAQ